MADFGWFGTQVAKVVTATLLGGFIVDLSIFWLFCSIPTKTRAWGQYGEISMSNLTKSPRLNSPSPMRPPPGAKLGPNLERVTAPGPSCEALYGPYGPHLDRI